MQSEFFRGEGVYGRIVDANGRTFVRDADADMHVPRGGKFIPVPMRYSMRFDAATGMHAGYLPGYPASHGCVRMPEENAIAFFNAVGIGTRFMCLAEPRERRIISNRARNRFGHSISAASRLVSSIYGIRRRAGGAKKPPGT